MFGPSFGQSSSYNYFPNNGDYNTWGANQSSSSVNNAQGGASAAQSSSSSRNNKNNHSYDEYYHRDQIQGVEHGMHGMSLDNRGGGGGGRGGGSGNNDDRGGSKLQPAAAAPKTEQPKETVPKKMTWASIASQPAKPQIRVSKKMQKRNRFIFIHFFS